MNNERVEYWLESLNAGLEEIEAYNVLTDEQKLQVAKVLEGSHECFGMAFYSPPASDMFNHEKGKLQQRIKELEKELETANSDFKKNVAMRHKCDPNDVRLTGNGHAEYR